MLRRGLTGERPSYVTFRIPGVTTLKGATSQRWTFTEAYWAAKLEPASLRLLIDWTGREGMVGKVVQGILRRNAPAFLKRAVEVAGVLWLGLFVSALTSLVLLGFAILRSILAIIPIQAAKDFVSYGQGERFLIGWWGDARSLVRDPVQSATVRLALDAAIADLRDKQCERIVVIAHSGGTIVSYMTLSDPALTASTDTLITHGQAIELGRRLEDLEREGTEQMQVQPSVSRIRKVEDRDSLRVGRWRDFFGTHDPAPFARPADLIPPDARPGDGATEVTNLRSIREDHGGYWTNDEGFVLPVMTEIERVGNGGTASRFTRTESPSSKALRLRSIARSWAVPTNSDEKGLARRESRVAMRSIWGRLALVGPIVAVLLAAGVAGGNIDQAAVLDAPGDLLATNYHRLPFNEIGTELNIWLVQGRPAADGNEAILPIVPKGLQEWATAITRGVLFLLFVIAAMWAMIPVDGWSRLPSGGALADFLTSAVVVGAAFIALVGLGTIPGIRLASEFLIVGGVVVVVLAISSLVYWRYANGQLPRVNSTVLSCGIAIALIVSIGSVVISFVAQPETRRWFVAFAFAMIAIRLVVGLGMWRWNAWDAAERQWFRGPRDTKLSRFAIYAIAVALGLLVVGVVAVLGGLEGPLRAAGVPLVEYLTPAVTLVGAALVLYLVVRDVSIAESVRT